MGDDDKWQNVPITAGMLVHILETTSPHHDRDKLPKQIASAVKRVAQSIAPPAPPQNEGRR